MLISGLLNRRLLIFMHFVHLMGIWWVATTDALFFMHLVNIWWSVSALSGLGRLLTNHEAISFCWKMSTYNWGYFED